MKKIITLLILCLSIFSLSMAQTENKNHFKKRSWHEAYIETGREMRAETKKVDCESEETQAYIDLVISMYDTIRDFNQKRMTLQRLGKSSCTRVMSFYERVIQEDSSEIFRCDAMMYLGWIDAVGSIPFLLEHEKRTDISDYEKANVGAVLSVLERYEEAEKILNRYCFCEDPKMEEACFWPYYMIGNRATIKYYRYLLSTLDKESRTCGIPVFMASLGETQTSLPLLKKMMQQEHADSRIAAIKGLDALGTRRGYRLLLKLKNDPDKKVKNMVLGIEKTRK